MTVEKQSPEDRARDAEYKLRSAEGSLKDERSQRFKWSAISLLAGAVAWWAVLGWGLGWMSAGSAEKMAKDQASAAVIEALVPVCVAQARAETEIEKFAQLAALTSDYERAEFVMKTDWAVMPSLAVEPQKPDKKLAAACAQLLKPKV